MDKKTENYMSMTTAVNDLLTREVGIVSSLVGLQTAHNDLIAKIAVERGYQLIQETGITGWATKKGEKKGDMITKAVKVVSGGTAYALANNDPVLFDEINYSKSRLETMRDEEVDLACKLIHDKASPIVVALVDYGILPADLTSLAAATGLYSAVKQMPSEKVDERQVAADGMKEAISDIRGIFEKMDRIVKTLQDTEPDFVKNYFNSREVYDIGVRHEPVVPPVPPVTP